MPFLLDEYYYIYFQEVEESNVSTPHIERLRNDAIIDTPININNALIACNGCLINPLDPAILSLAQNNFRIFNNDKNRNQNYCELLCKVTEGLIGFFLPRLKSKTKIGEENNELITLY